MGEELLTILETAEMLGVKRPGVYYYVKLGRLHLVYANAHAFIRRTEIENLQALSPKPQKQGQAVK